MMRLERKVHLLFNIKLDYTKYTQNLYLLTVYSVVFLHTENPKSPYSVQGDHFKRATIATS